MARTVAERSDVLPLLAEVFREHGYEGASLSLMALHVLGGVSGPPLWWPCAGARAR